MTKDNLNVTKRGFTLIEMLVVISLIGILAALSLVSFTSVQKQARDTVRKSDLKQYQNALEAYANLASGLFPSRTAVSSAYTTLCSDLNLKLEPDISCSQDPKTIVDATYYEYKYISDGTNGTATATKYVLWGKVENSSTTKYITYCSNGKIGESATAPSTSTCPI
jgi:prepilin-type N-terminal cleavage/methylation domain-containing protein